MSVLAPSTPVSKRQPIPPDTAANTAFVFLTSCCSLRKSRGQELAALAADLDWSKTLEMAEYHGVTPLIYAAVADHPAVAPPTVSAELRNRYEVNARKNLKFTAELFRILDCLNANSVPAIPLKGPLLAETVYGDLALRDFSDLDVLVQERDVTQAKAALQSLGYSPSTPLSTSAERAYLKTGYECTLDGPGGRNLLELQWNFAPRFYAVGFDVQGLFSRAQNVQLCGRTVRSLAPEDLLLTLCVHAAKHAWIRLHWLRDIAGALETQRLNWPNVVEHARGLGIARMVGVSLLLAERLLDAQLPRPAQELCASDPKILRLANTIEQQLPQADQHNAESLAYFLLMMRLRERPSDRMKFLWRLAATPGPGEWELIQLPNALFPLYRVVRICRLAGRAFRTR